MLLRLIFNQILFVDTIIINYNAHKNEGNYFNILILII